MKLFGKVDINAFYFIMEYLSWPVILLKILLDQLTKIFFLV